jgi:hypothetical protein
VFIILLLSPFITFINEHIALYGIGFATLAFLFIGISNAWDAATYHLFVSKGYAKEENKN